MRRCLLHLVNNHSFVGFWQFALGKAVKHSCFIMPRGCNFFLFEAGLRTFRPSKERNPKGSRMVNLSAPENSQIAIDAA